MFTLGYAYRFPDRLRPWHPQILTTKANLPRSREIRKIKNYARKRPKSKQVSFRSTFRFISLSHPTFSALPYKWRQELGELDVTVPVPKGTRGRDLNVVIAKKKLTVGLKGKEPILDGELCQEIKVDDSTWNLGLSHLHHPNPSHCLT